MAPTFSHLPLRLSHLTLTEISARLCLTPRLGACTTMDSFIQIPKTISSPEDPSAPSFLTSLSPEIRNAVYEILFLWDEPVLVHNAPDYYPIEPDEDWCRNRGHFEDEMWEFEQACDEAIGGDIEFSYDFHLALPLFRSCRQIYHESVGIFYGCNRFIISRALHRHDLDYDHHFIDDDYCQLLYAPAWLSQLGSQASFLRNVVVDVDAICPASCTSQMRDFDILPFVRFMWFHASDRCSLLFSHTGRELSVHKGDGRANDSPERKRAETYNNILHALSKQDILCLKKLGLSKRFLQKITIPALNDVASIHYADKERNYSHLDLLEISNEGRTLRVKPRNQEDNRLLNMGRDILYRIFSHVRSSALSSEVTFDLNNRRVHGLAMNILQVSKGMRSLYSAPFSAAMRSPIIITASTNDTTTTFNDFKALQDLIIRDWQNKNSVFPDIVLHASSATQVKLLLQINPPKRTPLSKVRIDIQGLIFRFGDQYLGTNVSVQIKSVYSSERHSYEETTTTRFAELQRRAFLLLSDMLANATVEDDVRVHEMLPSIWIDGNGTLLEASYPADDEDSAFSVPNRHAELRMKEVISRGYDMAADLDKIAPDDYEDYDFSWRLFSEWASLRDRYWPDYWIMRPDA
jgi:hypothetical protein